MLMSIVLFLVRTVKNSSFNIFIKCLSDKHMRKFPSNILLYFSIFTGGSGGKNRTRQHFTILTEIIITYLLVPQHIARQSQPLVFRVWRWQTDFMPKARKGQNQEKWPSFLGSAESLILCEKCTEVSSWNMYPHKSFKIHHHPCRPIIVELLLQGGADCR